MVEILQKVNSNYIDCMDGRMAVAYAQVSKRGRVQILEQGEVARQINSIAIPGAGLGPVAYLEHELGLSTTEAVSVTEQAFQAMGLMPTLHIDNNHGEFDLFLPGTDQISEDRLVKLVSRMLKGCGFGQLMWGDRADALIKYLRNRGWVVQVLVGEHPEDHAHRVARPGYAIHNPTAHDFGNPSFGMNDHEIEKTLETLEDVLRTTGVLSELGIVPPFLNAQAFPWFVDQFTQIASKLRPEIKEIKVLA